MKRAVIGSAVPAEVVSGAAVSPPEVSLPAVPRGARRVRPPRLPLAWARLLLGVLLALGFGAERAQARATQPPQETPERPLPDYLEMKEESEAFRAVADTFIGHAAKGEAQALLGLISPNMLDYAGSEAVAGILARSVIPFFAPFRAVATNVTITETTDGFGSHGFAYYMYAESKKKQEKPRPFVIYMVREGDTIVVANILVDHFVEGRHQPLG